MAFCENIKLFGDTLSLNARVIVSQTYPRPDLADSGSDATVLYT